MEELDRVIDALMKAKEDKIGSDMSAMDKSELIEALKKEKKRKIIQEIRDEYREEIVEESEAEIKKNSQNKKIGELRSLMWDGFVLAFIVGLAVNQATDFIGYYKGSVTLANIQSTVIIMGILLLICVLLYFYRFLRNAIEIFNENSNESGSI